MAIIPALPPPFDGFPAWQASGDPIWLKTPSWFYGVAVKDKGGYWRLAVGKLFLGYRGLELPKLPRGPGLFIDEHDVKAVTTSLSSLEVLAVLRSLAQGELHSHIVQHFKEEVLLPQEKPEQLTQWRREEETGRWAQYPNQTISLPYRGGTFGEWLSPPARRRLNGVLVGTNGMTFQGLKEIVDQLRFRSYGLSSSGVDSAYPNFEIAAELPLQLISFSYSHERGAYVVRVRVGNDISLERVRLSLGGGPRRSTLLSDRVWIRSSVAAEQYELEWSIPWPLSTEEVLAELNFDGTPIADRNFRGDQGTARAGASLQSIRERYAQPDRPNALLEMHQSLVDALQSGQCVLFAGAGVSLAAGLPSWKELLLQLLVWEEQRGLLNPELVDALLEGLDSGQIGLVADTLISAAQAERPRFDEFLRPFFTRPTKDLPELHQVLRSLPFAGVVTQNLDNILESTLPGVTVYVPQEAEALLGAFSRGERFVLKLMGTSSRPETVQLSPAQYTASLSSNHYFKQVLQVLLASRTLLFIGSSLDGIWDALTPLMLSGPPARQHFALIDAGDSAWKVKALALNRYGITVLPYPPREHGRVVDFLRQLRSAIPTEHSTHEENNAPFLTRIVLEDIGPFERFELKLEPGWNVLLGDNGVGKSIILRALGVALSGSDAQTHAERLIRTGRPSGRITLETARQRYETQIIRTDIGAEVRTSPATPLQAEGLLALGFPPLRAPGTDTGERMRVTTDRPTSADLLPLIKGEPDPRMQSLKEWILQADHQRQTERAEGEGEGPAAHLLKDFFEVIQRITPGLNLRLIRVEPERQRVVIATDDGEVPIEYVSQGTASVINWVGVLLQRLYAVSSQADNQPRERPALVLLDELDAHLHPGWQRVLVPTFRELFPNVQVVASTHSPLIVPTLGSNSIAVLRRHPESRQVQVHRPAEDIQGYRADQVLTSDMFGLETTHAPSIFDALRKYATLASQEALSPEQMQELRQLSFLLKTKVPSSEERQQARLAYQLIQDALDAKLKQLDPSEALQVLEEAQAQLVGTVTGTSK